MILSRFKRRSSVPHGDLFLDRGRVHVLTVEREQEGWQDDHCGVEAAYVADHREDCVDLPLALIEHFREVNRK